jgi:hypothetical protein
VRLQRSSSGRCGWSSRRSNGSSKRSRRQLLKFERNCAHMRSACEPERVSLAAVYRIIIIALLSICRRSDVAVRVVTRFHGVFCAHGSVYRSYLRLWWRVQIKLARPSILLLLSNQQKWQAQVKARQEYLAKLEKNKRARGKSKDLGDELLEEVSVSLSNASELRKT